MSTFRAASPLSRTAAFVLTFSVAPPLLTRALAGTGARGAVFAHVLSLSPHISAAVVGGAVLASLVVSALLGLASCAAWPRTASAPWLRIIRVAWTLWVCAFVLYPGFMAPVPVLRGLPLWSCWGLAGVPLLVSLIVPATRPTVRELAFLAVAPVAFFGTPGPGRLDVDAIAGRPLDSRDVLLVGFDSVSQVDTAGLFQAFAPRGAKQVIYANAWTPMSITATAWRSALSGAYPGPDDLMPGAQWPHDHEAWLPRELAARGYTSVVIQDEPATNVFGSTEWVRVPGDQGWHALMKDFAWRALFPLSATGGRWWVAALGGPANSVARWSYRPDWYRHDALHELGLAARVGPVLFVSHTCYMHAPLHLSLREVARLPRWWAYAPRALEGAGNPFTDAQAGGQADVLAIRMQSLRGELGRWLSDLRDQRALSRAHVVILSDHGPRGSWLPRDYTEHIQLVTFTPGRAGGTEVVSSPVSLVDVAPTVRAWLGLPTVRTDGRELPASGAGAPERRRVGRIEPVTLESLGIKLETINGAVVRRALRFHPDGSFEFAKELRRRASAGALPEGKPGLVDYVDRGG